MKNAMKNALASMGERRDNVGDAVITVQRQKREVPVEADEARNLRFFALLRQWRDLGRPKTWNREIRSCHRGNT